MAAGQLATKGSGHVGLGWDRGLAVKAGVIMKPTLECARDSENRGLRVGKI